MSLARSFDGLDLAVLFLSFVHSIKESYIFCGRDWNLDPAFACSSNCQRVKGPWCMTVAMWTAP